MPKTIENYNSQQLVGSLRQKAWQTWGAVTFLALGWIVLIISAPIAKNGGFDAFSNSVYAFFGFLCHQEAARSFHLFEYAFAVCSRCFGVYAGLLAGAVVYPFLRRIEETEPLPRFWLFLAMIPMAIDWSLGFFEILENTHFSRFLTGLILGAACAVFIIPAIVELSYYLSNKYKAKRLSR